VLVSAASAFSPLCCSNVAWIRTGCGGSTGTSLDPAEELTVSFFTQLLPSSTYPIRPQLRQLVYQALTS